MPKPGSHTQSDVLTLGQRVAEARASAGLTVAQAATASGLTESEWARMEAGGSPKVSALWRIAAALGLRPYELLD